MIEVYTIKALAAWAPYLVNGDDSGMTDTEIRECIAWLKTLDDWIVVAAIGDTYPGMFGGKMADCIDYTLHRLP